MSAETPAPPRPGKVVVSAEELRALVAGVFAARGARAADAAAVADALVWANLRGVDSHGVSRVPRYLELFDKGESVADAEVTVTRPRAAIAIVDAHAAPGPVAMNRAADEAIAGARECGIGWASVRGTVHTGAIGYYASRIADAGMAAVGVVAGVPNMAYAGAKGAAVATSPLAVAVPAGRHDLVLLDMATAVMALGRIAQLKAAGKELPPGVALTADGEPTTDPALAKVPTPVGGAKGAGMSLVFEMLASGLVANPIVPGVPLRREGGQAAPAERLPARHRRRRVPAARGVHGDDRRDRRRDQVPPPSRRHRRDPGTGRARPPHRGRARRDRHPARSQGLA